MYGEINDAAKIIKIIAESSTFRIDIKAWTFFVFLYNFARLIIQLIVYTSGRSRHFYLD